MSLRSLLPKHEAEASGVVQPQDPIAKFDIDMIVLAWWRVSADDPQTAGHSQMHQQCAVLEYQQQVLCAPLDGVKGAVSDDIRQIGGNRLSKPRVADQHPADVPARQVWRNPAAGGFDFGEFRHRSGEGT